MSVLSGLDRLGSSSLTPRLTGTRVGVLAHAASVDAAYRPITRVLGSHGVEPVVIFGPEHGFMGAAQDMKAVASEERAHGPRVVSLYGDTADDLVPCRADLVDLDWLLIDLVDVGSRYYTYVWTALLAARAAARAGVHTVILDRPNPLGGNTWEGRPVDPGFESFVGWHDIPIRHGLTLGEVVALFFEGDLGSKGELSIVPCAGWKREQTQPSWSSPWVLPSPNMPSYETARVYPGGCFLEGTNLSEGRGHTRPFEFFGAPFLDGTRLAAAFESLGFEACVLRPVTFRPTFHKHGGENCGGGQVHVTDERRFRPVAVYAALIALARAQAPEGFVFRRERYEFIDDIPAFDLLTGSPEAREAIDAGAPARDVAEAVSAVAPSWEERHRSAIRRAETAAAWV